MQNDTSWEEESEAGGVRAERRGRRRPDRMKRSCREAKREGCEER